MSVKTTVILTEVLNGFISTSSQMLLLSSKTEHDHFLPHPSQFVGFNKHAIRHE
jgi:hypothetical protein